MSKAGETGGERKKGEEERATAEYDKEAEYNKPKREERKDGRRAPDGPPPIA